MIRGGGDTATAEYAHTAAHASAKKKHTHTHATTQQRARAERERPNATSGRRDVDCGVCAMTARQSMTTDGNGNTHSKAKQRNGLDDTLMMTKLLQRYEYEYSIMRMTPCILSRLSPGNTTEDSFCCVTPASIQFEIQYISLADSLCHSCVKYK